MFNLRKETCEKCPDTACINLHEGRLAIVRGHTIARIKKVKECGKMEKEVMRLHREKIKTLTCAY